MTNALLRRFCEAAAAAAGEATPACCCCSCCPVWFVRDAPSSSSPAAVPLVATDAKGSTAAEALRAAAAAAGVAAGDAAGVALTAAPLVDALSLAVAASTIATGVSYWFRHGHTRVR